MLIIIDNYDSFTYNLVQAFATLGFGAHVIRNDQIDLPELKQLKPTRIVISPGPGRPENAGISCEVIRELGEQIPILGICLGHQCIAAVFGAEIGPSIEPRHGKTSWITYNDSGIFKDLPNPFEAMRYHSLEVKPESLPEELVVTATSDNDTIMGLAHRSRPIFGVQFHPESILSPSGSLILKNFIQITEPIV